MSWLNFVFNCITQLMQDLIIFCFLLLDVNECLNLDACLNGGTCRNLIGSYRCECPPGWFGDQCELGKYIIGLDKQNL